MERSKMSKAKLLTLGLLLISALLFSNAQAQEEPYNETDYT